MTEQGMLFERVQQTEIYNRRYLGNKYRLLSFIDAVISKHCENVNSLADIFAGTGVVASLYPSKILVTNDILYSNYLCHVAWFSDEEFSEEKLSDLIAEYNKVVIGEDNYMSKTFAGTYFGMEACRQIGYIRADIQRRAYKGELNFREQAILIAALMYGMDKIANTCGHYDAFRQGGDLYQQLSLRLPHVFSSERNRGNRCFNEDANELVKRIRSDLVYIDPPYNSRQYCDSYHVLENVARWDKPSVSGVARKMDRSSLKSAYCTLQAPKAFKDLIANIDARYILVSYNNMAEKGDGRSNAKIADNEILDTLRERGNVEIFSQNYRSFTTGKSDHSDNTERLFLVTLS